MDEKNTPSTTRRGMMKGVGGFAALSMSNTTIAEAADIIQEQEVPTDPHTLDTYRSIVDAIVPETPELADELGEEHVPGGLAVELEKFIVYDFNHFQEIRLETLRTPVESGKLGAPDGSFGEFGEMFESPTDGLSQLSPEDRMPLDMFETTLDTTGSGPDLDAVLDLVDDSALSELTGTLDLSRLAELTDFGAADRLDISIPDAPPAPGETGPADIELLVEAGNETIHRVQQNYPYAQLFPFVFDLVAAEFLLRQKNEDQPSPNPQFPGGGTFTKLSREDRLRALWTIVDGGVLDRMDGLLSPMLPQVGILKYVVMACNGLHGFGYYTEWSAYGDTKTNLPTNRELQKPADEAQSRTQTDYPGPAPGYAADWFHAVDGGFRDPPAQSLNYEQKGTDLTGEDVLSEEKLDGEAGGSGGGDSGSDDGGSPLPLDETADDDLTEDTMDDDLSGWIGGDAL